MKQDMKTYGKSAIKISRLNMVISLRSGWSLRNGYYDKDFCKSFLSGEYPDCESLSLLQLKQLKLTMEDYDLIQPEVLDTIHRVDIIVFLLAQWKKYHENVTACSTPPNSSLYKTTYERMCEYCKVTHWETDSDEEYKFDEEFLCNICGQLYCVRTGFHGRGQSVHSPAYGKLYIINSSHLQLYIFLNLLSIFSVGPLRKK